MPRKAKEKIDEIEIIDEKKVKKEKKTAGKTRKSSLAKIIENVANSFDESEEKNSTKKTTSRKSSAKNSETKKTATSSKATTKKSVSKEDSTPTKTTKKKSVAKKTATAKKATVKKSSAKTTTAKSASKDASSKKISSNKSSSNKKNATTKSSSAKSKSIKKEKNDLKSNTKKDVLDNSPIHIIEYYDFPYKYGNTIVRLLAQTPKTLFVYWEVSDLDIENFKKTYGDDFFQKTKPVLIVHNLTLNKTMEIEINDFANCWYLNTEDSDCKFDIELARKFIDKSNNSNNTNTSDYLYIAQSNDLQSPNDHILFEKIKEFVVFRNVNNGNVIKKNIKSFKFLKDIYKFYKELYDEDILNNPSSQFKF